tara:strand:- start:116 stop:454 length:339 start_codon:yes stop_codon:yes gene_type:complete
MQSHAIPLDKIVAAGTISVEEIKQELETRSDRAEQLKAMMAAIQHGRLETFRTIATEINKFGITGKERAKLMKTANSIHLNERMKQYFRVFVKQAIKIRLRDRYIITETTFL